MDVLRDVRYGSLMELLYANDLVLCGESLNEVMAKYGRWKNAMEGKGLRVNVSKTKVIQLFSGKKSRKEIESGSLWCLCWVSWLWFNSLYDMSEAGLLRTLFVDLMCLGRWVYYRVGNSFVCRPCIGDNCSVVEKLKGWRRFRGSGDVLLSGWYN